MKEKHISFGGLMTLTATDAVQALTENGKETFSKLWLYPAKSIAGKKLVKNVGTIYTGKLGTGPTVTPDALDKDDLPIKYELPDGQQMKLADVIVQGQAGDGIYFNYWP